MTFRRAVKSDASSLAALSIEVWLGTYLRQGVSAVFADYVLAEYTAERMENLIGDEKEHIIVSENTDGIDGYIRATSGNVAPVEGCSTTEISTFYVQPRHHGRGLGTGLLTQLLNHCSEKGVASVWLTTNSENTPAIDFYLARGFLRVGQTGFQIGDQAYPNDVFSFSLDDLGQRT